MSTSYLLPTPSALIHEIMEAVGITSSHSVVEEAVEHEMTSKMVKEALVVTPVATTTAGVVATGVTTDASLTIFEVIS